ncbi:unnamed protein product, partial [Symbiodinium pilosum]
VVAPAAATPIAAGVKALIDSFTSSEREQTLLELVKIFHRNGNDTCILVDEANIALPAGESFEDRQNAMQALQYFVMLTKEQKQASVVFITSELGYPFRLQGCGMNLQDISNIVIVNEVPEADMLRLMMDEWGMSQDLAKEFFSYFGGNIAVCSQAGWSPVYDLNLDAAAKLIAEKNVGGVVPKRAMHFDLPDNIWNGTHEYALVPSGTLMRWKIGKELARRESM